MSTVRDLVAAMQKEIRETDLAPARSRELLAKLTALIGNCNAESRVADMEYATVLLTCLSGEEAANRARIRAETTQQYLRKRVARDTKDEVVELVRVLKCIIHSVEEEMRLSR